MKNANIRLSEASEKIETYLKHATYEYEIMSAILDGMDDYEFSILEYLPDGTHYIRYLLTVESNGKITDQNGNEVNMHTQTERILTA